MTAVIPVFLFLVALNHERLAVEPHWDNRYLLLVFAVPAVAGLVAEAAAHRWIRHVGCRVASGCVLVNLAGGVVGLALAWAGFLATPWFDAWSASSVFAVMAILVAVGVFGVGGRLNSKTRGGNATLPRSYVWNAVAVIIGGVLGVGLGLGLRGWLW